MSSASTERPRPEGLSPFYEKEGFRGERRLLLVSQHFPPAGSAGALRWQKLAGFASERGWQLDVITVPADEQDLVDWIRMEDLPAGTRVFDLNRPRLLSETLEAGLFRLVKRWRSRRKSEVVGAGAASQPSKIERPKSLPPEDIHWWPRDLRDVQRAYWAWLDFATQAAWAAQAAHLGQRLLAAHGHEAVITCGPAHMMAHEAGRRLSSATGVPLVLDLRDPWSDMRRFTEYAAHRLWFMLARRHERRAVRQASLVVTNTLQVRETMAARHKNTATRFLTVMNGYDDEPMPKSRHTECFTIAYAGGIYLDRDPRPLFRGVASVVREQALTPAQLRVRLIGAVESYQGIPTLDLAEAEGIRAFVETRPRIPRDELMDALADASMLVSLPQDSPWAVPSKLFEYMRFDAWLLVFAEPDTPSEIVLRETGADVVSSRDEAAIADVIRSRYLEYSGGRRPVPLAQDDRFSRRRQADLLLDALDECTRGGASSRRAGPTRVVREPGS